MLKLRKGKSSFKTYCKQIFLSSVEYNSMITYSRVLRTVSSQVFNVSEDGDSTTSQSTPFQCLTILTVKKVFLKSVFEFLPIASSPVTGQSQLHGVFDFPNHIPAGSDNALYSPWVTCP